MRIAELQRLKDLEEKVSLLEKALVSRGTEEQKAFEEKVMGEIKAIKMRMGKNG